MIKRPEINEIFAEFEEYYKDVDELVKTSMASAAVTGNIELIKCAMKDAYLRGYFSAVVSMIGVVEQIQLEKKIKGMAVDPTKPMN